MTFMQIEEYFIAVLCFVLLAIIWVPKALTGITASQPLPAILKLAHAAIAVVACVVLITITDVRREDKPWSNLQKVLKKHGSATSPNAAGSGRTDIRFIGGYNVSLPALGTVTVPEKFDLRWLFVEYDFAQYFRPMIDSVIITNGKENKIESAIFIDIPGRSQFVGFYLPRDVNTYAVCKMLPDAAGLLVAHFAAGHEFLGFGLFDKSQTPFKDLASTGRVYVYYEGILSLPEAGDLTTLFESRHLGLVLRGDEWLRMKILSRRRQSSGPRSRIH
jgi:hypothetical protein